MKNILKIMRLDLIAMKAKKFSLGKAFIAAFIISTVIGLLLPPFLILFALAFGMIAVPSFLDVEDKNEGNMTFSVLPVTRRENVIARYGLITLALTVTGAVTLIVLKLSLILDFSHFFEGTSGINESLSDIFGLRMNDFGLFSLFICAIIAISLIFSAVQLGSFFKNGKNKNGKSALRLILILFIFWIAIAAILVVENSSLEVKVLSSALSVIGNLFIALSSPYNGALLGAFILVAAYGFVFYKAACSVIDYEARDL